MKHNHSHSHSHNVFAPTQPAVYERTPGPDTQLDIWAEENLDNRPMSLMDKAFIAVGIVALIGAAAIIFWPEVTASALRRPTTVNPSDRR